ncbi:MAG: PKD domain-containing protein, partial [Nitrososphaera sp.]
MKVTDIFGEEEVAVPTNALGQNLWLDVASAPPGATLNAWAPYSPVGADGHQGTVFTFSASAVAPAGVDKLQWDFDGDGAVDATSTIPGSPVIVSGITKTHVYGVAGTFTPQVRAVDKVGQISAWDPYDVLSSVIQLDVVNPPPTVAMNVWNPHSTTAPDGTTSTVFTLSADATCQIGLAGLEWDIDGNGTVDVTTALNGENSVTVVTVQGTFGAPGNYTPKVRSISITGLDSGWDSFNIGTTVPVADIVNPPPNDAPLANAGADQTVSIGSAVTLNGTASSDSDAGDSITDYIWSQKAGPISVTLDKSNPALPTFVANTNGVYTFELKVVDEAGAQSTPDAVIVTVVNVPVATMNPWIPYSSTGPDGNRYTVFTFSADATADAGIAKFEWDFDGNGSVDATTTVSGSPSSAEGTNTYSYGADGTFTPKVRVVDAAGIKS